MAQILPFPDRAKTPYTPLELIQLYTLIQNETDPAARVMLHVLWRMDVIVSLKEKNGSGITSLPDDYRCALNELQ